MRGTYDLLVPVHEEDRPTNAPKDHEEQPQVLGGGCADGPQSPTTDPHPRSDGDELPPEGFRRNLWTPPSERSQTYAPGDGDGEGLRRALARDASAAIRNREALLGRLGSVRSFCSSPGDGRDHHNRRKVQRLLYGLHCASLCAVEAIVAWNGAAVAAGSSGGGSGERFLWEGRSYLARMLTDSDFVLRLPEARAVLGTNGSDAPPSGGQGRNPFLLPLNVDAVMEYAPGAKSKMRSRMGKENCDSCDGGEASMDGVPWEVDLRRVRCAASHILSEECLIKSGRLIDMDSKSGGPDSEGTRLRFPPLQLDRRELEGACTDLKPPIEVAVVVASARLLLGCDDDIPPQKIHTFTREIAHKMLRLSLEPLFDKMRSFDPERHRLSAGAIRLLYPIVIHDRLNPEALRRSGAGPSIGEMAAWVRAVVLSQGGERAYGEYRRSRDGLSSPKKTGSAGGGGTPEAAEIFGHHGDGGRLSGHGKKSKDKGSVWKRLGTVNNDKDKDTSDRPEGNVNRTPTKDVNRADCGDNTADMAPVPVPCLLHVTEGSARATVRKGNLMEALVRGDVIRIYHPHHSCDWTVSTDAEHPFTHEEVTLTRPYDHSRVIQKETELKAENPIERLHSPYSKKAANPTGEAPEANTEIDTMTSDCTPHKLNDGSSARKIWNLSGARVWRLIPEKEDRRPAWRKQYDDGSVPWSRDWTDSCECVDHFHVKVRWSDIESNCRDACAPHRAIHQQRVNYFEEVEVSKVIEETFRGVCAWHPVGNSVDIVKWARLARKMRFLSRVRNAGHEIDMAFLRRNSDRKLDLAGFELILRDIATTKYPSASSVDDALKRVLWETVVMLPSVNDMVWTVAKRMAVLEEARRVCAQTRIAAFFRWTRQRARYLPLVDAAICISKYYRRMIATKKRILLLRVAEEDRIYRLQFACSMQCQKVWRGYHRRKLFLAHQARRRDAERRELASHRSHLRRRRKKREATIVFRRAIPIHGMLSIVTMRLREGPRPGTSGSLRVGTYVPAWQDTFEFSLGESVLRGYMHRVLGTSGPLSWNEMINGKTLILLCERLRCRMMNGRPTILLSRRDIGFRGKLIVRKMIKFKDEVRVLFVHRSPSDVVFRVYDPKACAELRTSISLEQLDDWIRTDEEERKIRNRSEEQGLDLMHTDHQTELIAWLVKRIQIDRDPNSKNIRLLLQCEADEEKKERITAKIQSVWRKLVAKQIAKREVRTQFEKVFDRDRRMHCYVNVRTGTRQWSKPRLLGAEDLGDPPDEWRKIERHDANTGERIIYYANPATGQTSWLSEEDAAQMLQRRVRERQARDVVGPKLDMGSVVRAVKFIRDTEDNFERRPEKLSHRVNYALLCHTVHFDFHEARALYKGAIEQSSCHPVISRAYGIFLLATCEEPLARTFQRSCILFKEAAVSDPANLMFKSAADKFFHWAVLANPDHPMALLNYALLFQCIMGDYDRTERLYRRALAADPSNQLVSRNFALFDEQRYPGGAYYAAGSGCPPPSAVRRSRVVEEGQQLGDWKRMVDSMCPLEAFQFFWYNTKSKVAQFKDPNEGG